LETGSWHNLERRIGGATSKAIMSYHSKHIFAVLTQIVNSLQLILTVPPLLRNSPMTPVNLLMNPFSVATLRACAALLAEPYDDEPAKTTTSTAHAQQFRWKLPVPWRTELKSLF